MTAPYFDWTDDRVANLRRWYLELELTPAAIAVRFQVKRHVVCGKIVRMGLAKERPDYLVDRRRTELAHASHAARRARKAAKGGFVWNDPRIQELRRLYVDEDQPCALIAERLGATPVEVRRKVKALGYTKLRKAKGIGRRRVQKLAAASNVIRLPTGHAAGITGWEDALKVAPAPPKESAEERHARAVRAGFKAALYHAGRSPRPTTAPPLRVPA